VVQYKDFVIECAVQPAAPGSYQAHIFITILEGGQPINGFEFAPYPGAYADSEPHAREDAEQWARRWIDDNF
jgi:hypothetical protein